MTHVVPYCVGPRPPVVDREPTALFRFTLPPALLLRAQVGRYVPNLHRVRLDVGDDGVVSIAGYHGLISDATPALLDQALRFLVTLATPDRSRGSIAPQSFSGEWLAANGCRQRYLIALGARAAIAQDARALLVR